MRGRHPEPAPERVPPPPPPVIATEWPGSNPTARVLRDIARERQRQDRKFPNQHLPNGTNLQWTHWANAARNIVDMAVERGDLTWCDVAREEIMEAFAEVDPAKLRVELIQVAAVFARWIEDIDRG